MSRTRPDARRVLNSSDLVDSTAYISDDDSDAPPRRSICNTRKHTQEVASEEEFVDKAPAHHDTTTSKRTRLQRRVAFSIPGEDEFESDSSEPDAKRPRVGARRSERTTRHLGDMAEVGTDEVFRSDEIEHIKTRTHSVIRVFQVLPNDDDFAMRHATMCEACGADNSELPFVYCQGCSFTYHQPCLGTDASREHVLTQVTQDDWILQCKRCVGVAHKRQQTAPDLGKCITCGEHGPMCLPTQQLERTGQIESLPLAINNADRVLARCWSCFRAWHTEHQIPPIDDSFRRWQCGECMSATAKIASLLAWRPVDESNYDESFDYDRIEEEEKLYLVKWQGSSYSQCSWMPGTWVWSKAARTTLKAFAKNDSTRQPKRSIEEIIPQDYTHAEIILDVVYYNTANQQSGNEAELDDIEWALIKYKSLGYEEVVWDNPPSTIDAARYADFVHAYNCFLVGRKMRQPRPVDIRSRLRAARQQDFDSLAKSKQPDLVEGGTLMKYQIDGMNWLYYQWYSQTNAILGDEMGLGKTIQIIAFLSTLIQDWTCFPHLIVVPNSTCENWLREIKRWAPKLRVVAYYGSKVSRKMSYDYELFPDDSHDLRSHIVITSYEAASSPDEEGQRLFRSTTWQSLIVDEGQRLKNDESMLYASLSKVKAPFKVLMTGTPLQNNQRELFNLLQFLDKHAKAVDLEEQYRELDEAKIQELHGRIKPCFLRRTKTEVLGFLPPMSQIIVPISMSYLQKETYRRILTKNVNLVKALNKINPKIKQSDSVNLNNILMQLRKCLCHPFAYSREIEDLSSDPISSMHNLIEGSGKLKLLHILLPKLKESGHRVLIFSQFLDMLDIVEDFLRAVGMSYQRLDGQISSIEKQTRLDQFNAPDSELFAFLLSTRAGGVGINLATADTVIILDPDFNPHQDMQALSRAHRIGQIKKVLCLQLVTKDSVEERILQIGRKKLALDKALIQDMNDSSPLQEDLLTILRHGAVKLLKEEENPEADIVYDDASINALLDRTQIEGAPANQDPKNIWSFAKVWTNKQTAEQQNVVNFEDKQASAYREDWDSILADREKAASKAAKQKSAAFGRGRRARASVNYGLADMPDGLDLNDSKPTSVKSKVMEETDDEFSISDSGQDSGREMVTGDAKKAGKLQTSKPASKPTSMYSKSTPKSPTKKTTASKGAVSKGKHGGLSLANFNVTSGWASKPSKPRAKPVSKPVAKTATKAKPLSVERAGTKTVTNLEQSATLKNGDKAEAIQTKEKADTSS